MANQWLRLWHDMPTDPKWRTIARISGQRIGDVMAVYLHLLVCGSNATERGQTQSFNAEDVASALDMETSQVTFIVDAMQGRVLDGCSLAGWDKRQPAREDGAAERAKQWREAKKAEANAGQTQANAGERKRTLDKDKDTEKKDISNPSGSHPPAGGLAARFGDFWLAWPKGDRKQDKAKCLDHWKRHKLADAAPAILADVRAKRGTPKWADGFVEAPLTYLRGRRWEDGGDTGTEVSPANTVSSAAADRTAAELAADARRFEAVKASPEEQARIAETIQRARAAIKAVA